MLSRDHADATLFLTELLGVTRSVTPCMILHNVFHSSLTFLTSLSLPPPLSFPPLSPAPSPFYPSLPSLSQTVGGHRAARKTGRNN